MKLDVDQLVLLGLLSASIHWLVARAHITKWFWAFTWWPKYFPFKLFLLTSALLACAACSGFWIGLGLGFAGVRPIGAGRLAVMASGLAGIFLTPIFEGTLLWGLERTHLDQ